ncbi:hypothetical protein IscW_ISCW001533 [Ixodes scapularis]|uniref:Uncharacterized protein n=1 Tax=Ixodes scapularis TaxID=6945 RepID=B7P413_IXOSC|nr:hypothetical protein IscW_ISCW001533 [Ixodes scapularis]|eukprot:XP_002405075.1 hypothetical protein IscW_ISCW001533 [Ixodes scapularis]
MHLEARRCPRSHAAGCRPSARGRPDSAARIAGASPSAGPAADLVIVARGGPPSSPVLMASALGQALRRNPDTGRIPRDARKRDHLRPLFALTPLIAAGQQQVCPLALPRAAGGRNPCFCTGGFQCWETRALGRLATASLGEAAPPQDPSQQVASAEKRQFAIAFSANDSGAGIEDCMRNILLPYQN